MHCAVAVANSPVFSPSRVSVSSIFCKQSVSSPEILKLAFNGGASPSSTVPSSPSKSSALPPPPQLFSPLKLSISSNEGSLPSSSLSSSTTSPTLLKRKRPARIDIPMMSLNCFAAPSPAVKERLEWVEEQGDGYSVCCKRGRRGAMEDRFSARVDFEGDSKQAFFGVFDGHGGPKAAEFAAKNIGKNIMEEAKRRDKEELEDVLKQGYLITDADFLREDVNGGTCCVTALICKGNLVVSNAGDCRAVMCRGGVAEALTADHRPSRKDERSRIESLGGYVDCCNGVWRIQGSLAVSRGIGDRHLKQWVIAEPETKILQIQPDCEFLILASDGLWDTVSNQEAVDVVRPLCIGVDKPEPFSACKKLIDLSYKRGSTDDISVMVIQLGHFL
ncbi:PPM-type phosphatase-like domain [Dillenia turbinata]|uniref:protein-serine/threonine phosphatase n=1 Tax=Dillenia turbinata TaxID=194707 RepID=A0AAN8V9U8_9MAGN